MIRKTKFTSSYHYNPLNPINWSLFSLVAIISSSLLIIDWILGLLYQYPVDKSSFLANIFNTNIFFTKIFPLITLFLIIGLGLFAHEDFNEKPFFIAIIIKLLSYFGLCTYTFLGYVAEFILNIGCWFLIIMVLIFIYLFDIEYPIEKNQGIIIGVCFLTASFLLHLFFYGWRMNEAWGLVYLITCYVGYFIIKREHQLIGGLPILIISFFNNYVVPFELDGLKIGADLMLIISLFIIVKRG